MSILHFGHLNRLFRDGPHISHLGSQIVNTSQVAPEDLSVQRTGVGVGRGPCEGVSKIQFYGQRGTIWKIRRLREMAFHAFKKYGQHFSAEIVPLVCRMLAQILRTAFSPQFQAVHKIPSGNRSAARKKVARGPQPLFPGQP